MGEESEKSVSASDAPIHPRGVSSSELRVSRYENVASMLIALLILLGVIVAMLFLIWLGSQIFAGQAAVPVELVDIGTGEGAPGEGMMLDTPDAEEVGEEIEIEEQPLKETLETIANAVAAREPQLDDPSLVERARRRGGSRGTGHGLGGGGGTGRGLGQSRGWEIAFDKGSTLETYARQLDFFRIELGVLLPDNKVQYAANLATATPTVRVGPADQEKRYYLTWRRGELQQADKELLAKAGIAAEGKLILKFLPPDVEATLMQLEKMNAKARGDPVRSTRFGVRTEGNGFSFYVIEQTYK